jgi:hypothetical protein
MPSIRSKAIQYQQQINQLLPCVRDKRGGEEEQQSKCHYFICKIFFYLAIPVHQDNLLLPFQFNVVHSN